MPTRAVTEDPFSGAWRSRATRKSALVKTSSVARGKELLRIGGLAARTAKFLRVGKGKIKNAIGRANVSAAATYRGRLRRIKNLHNSNLLRRALSFLSIIVPEAASSKATSSSGR